MSFVEVQQSRARGPLRCKELSRAIGRAGFRGKSKIKMAGLPAPIRILVVDDEPSTRIMLQRWIRRSMAAEVSEASDGLEALEAISSGNIEILISDINMPVLDGIEMLTLLQGDAALKKMEVLIVSHVESEEKIRKIISLGVSGYLLKPLQYDSVAKRLQCAAARILERRERPGQEIERSRLRILVADPDPNYCDFAKSTLEVDFSVQTARGVAGVLVKSVRFKPDAILISPEVPGLKLEFLIDKLKSIPDFDQPTGRCWCISRAGPRTRRARRRPIHCGWASSIISTCRSGGRMFGSS